MKEWKKWLLILAILCTPFILGILIHRTSGAEFDSTAAIRTAQELTGVECTILETSHIPVLHSCTRDDQVAYLLKCGQIEVRVCCGLMKDCSVSLK